MSTDSQPDDTLSLLGALFSRRRTTRRRSGRYTTTGTRRYTGTRRRATPVTRMRSSTLVRRLLHLLVDTLLAAFLRGNRSSRR